MNVSETFRADQIVVIVEMFQERYVVYNVSIHIVPQVPLNFTNSTELQLTLSYDTRYNITINTGSLCPNSSFSIELYYGKPLL